ncbi:DEAD-box ATP-dependent RNA helicase 29-like [Spinacia oleracea]|uniref:DEAD-box ATP-dependent RNA helicase 29-like n=1 Tax=Spinacia oleracea TaxID=3562 RepID=A0ABM3RDT4_SPIOL|nr:DEAD-box ATP-dependent RNA helicase 29-like [Spinacia oleracea]
MLNREKGPNFIKPHRAPNFFATPLVARNGRTGTAYSFVTPKDLPYVLDLHLFLSKPIWPAPSKEEEVINDMANGVTVYGRFPQTVIDLVQDKVRVNIDSSADLYDLQKSCINAFREYEWSNPAPSLALIRRAEELSGEGLHPMFNGVLQRNELGCLAW